MPHRLPCIRTGGASSSLASAISLVERVLRRGGNEAQMVSERLGRVIVPRGVDASIQTSSFGVPGKVKGLSECYDERWAEGPWIEGQARCESCRNGMAAVKVKIKSEDLHVLESGFRRAQAITKRRLYAKLAKFLTPHASPKQVECGRQTLLTCEQEMLSLSLSISSSLPPPAPPSRPLTLSALGFSTFIKSISSRREESSDVTASHTPYAAATDLVTPWQGFSNPCI